MPSRHQPIGFLPVAHKGQYAHRFGGTPSTPLPVCPNCSKPFVTFCTLDTSDPRISLSFPFPELPLIYCMRCAACWYSFSYQLNEAGEMSPLQIYRGSSDWWDEWYAEFTNVLPVTNFDLISMPPKLAAIIKKLTADIPLTKDENNQWNHLLGHKRGKAVDAINQVGGMPYSIQRVPSPECLLCSETMQFLASLCNDEDAGFRFMPDAWSAQIIFFFCTACRVVSVIHST